MSSFGMPTARFSDGVSARRPVHHHRHEGTLGEARVRWPGDARAPSGYEAAHDADDAEPRRRPRAERNTHVDRARRARPSCSSSTPSRARVRRSSTGASASAWLTGQPRIEATTSCGWRCASDSSSRPRVRASVGPDRVHEHVGAVEQLTEPAPPVVAVEVEFDAALAAPPRPEAGLGPQRLPARRFDHHDVGARLGQHHGGDQAGDAAAEVDDADPLQGRCGHVAQRRHDGHLSPTRRNDADTVAMIRPPLPSSVMRRLDPEPGIAADHRGAGHEGADVTGLDHHHRPVLDLVVGRSGRPLELVHGGRLEGDVDRTEVQGRVRRGQLGRDPLDLQRTVRARHDAEHVTEGRQVRGVLQLVDRVVDRLEPGWHVAEADAAARRDGDHSIVVVGVDDAGAAEAQLPPDADHLAQHLDAPHVAGRVEHRVAHGHRGRHALVVAPPRLGRGDAQRRRHHAAGAVAHVAAQRHRPHGRRRCRGTASPCPGSGS